MFPFRERWASHEGEGSGRFMAVAKPSVGESAIELITADRGPHYEPFGWHHWPEHPWLAYQFRRGLGETQEGGGSVSEGMQAGWGRVPGGLGRWHAAWVGVGGP